MRVFLVEDNQRMKAEMERAIRSIPGGNIVKTADAATTATQWLAENPEGWDLAIVDLFLASGHGFEVLRNCRRALPQQRVVAVSNYARGPVDQYARDAGADRFFDKSMDHEALFDYCLAHSRELSAAR